MTERELVQFTEWINKKNKLKKEKKEMGITAKSFGKDKSLLVKVQNRIDNQKSAKVVRKSQKKQ